MNATTANQSAQISTLEEQLREAMNQPSEHLSPLEGLSAQTLVDLRFGEWDFTAAEQSALAALEAKSQTAIDLSLLAGLEIVRRDIAARTQTQPTLSAALDAMLGHFLRFQNAS